MKKQKENETPASYLGTAGTHPGVTCCSGHRLLPAPLSQRLFNVAVCSRPSRYIPGSGSGGKVSSDSQQVGISARSLVSAKSALAGHSARRQEMPPEKTVLDP